MKAVHVKIPKIVIDEKSQDFKDLTFVCSGSIIPGDDKETSIPLNFDSESNLTLSNEHLTFPYGDKSKSALSLVIKSIKKVDEKNTNSSEFCRVTLPLNWFQKNTVTDEVFPLTNISKGAKIGEINAKIHVNENDSYPFTAQPGKLLVKITAKNTSKKLQPVPATAMQRPPVTQTRPQPQQQIQQPPSAQRQPQPAAAPPPNARPAARPQQLPPNGYPGAQQQPPTQQQRPPYPYPPRGAPAGPIPTPAAAYPYPQPPGAYPYPPQERPPVGQPPVQGAHGYPAPPPGAYPYPYPPPPQGSYPYPPAGAYPYPPPPPGAYPYPYPPPPQGYPYPGYPPMYPYPYPAQPKPKKGKKSKSKKAAKTQEGDVPAAQPQQEENEAEEQ